MQESKSQAEFLKQLDIIFNSRKSGDDDRALREARLLLAEYDSQPSLHFIIGHMYFMKENYKKATEHFRKATLLSPKSEKASLGLFHSLWSSYREVEALEEMKRYLTNYTSKEYAGILRSIQKAIKEKTTEQGVVADGSRLHFGPEKQRSVKRENVQRRAGKRARG